MSKKEEQSSAVNSLVDIIKVLVRDEINKQDNTVLCKVASVNDDGSYNVYVIPDESTIISNIPALNTFDLEPGDYVYVYKIKNQLNNSFIIRKVGEVRQPLQDKLLELQDEIDTVRIGLENISSSTGDLYLPITAGPEAYLTGDLYIKKATPQVVLVNSQDQSVKIRNTIEDGQPCMVVSLDF